MTDYTNLKKRDIVVATNHGHPLRCGSGIYDRAIVLKANPLVLVSDWGDMRWSCYTGPLKKTGKVGYFKYLKLLWQRGKK